MCKRCVTSYPGSVQRDDEEYRGVFDDLNEPGVEAGAAGMGSEQLLEESLLWWQDLDVAAVTEEAPASVTLLILTVSRTVPVT